MRIGTQTSDLIYKYSPDALFALFRETGFDCVDFGLDVFLSGKIVESGESSPVFDGSLDETRAVLMPYKEAARRAGIGFYQAHAPYKFQAESTRVQLAVKRCVEICGFLECPYLIVHPLFLEYDDRRKWSSHDEWSVNVDYFSGLMQACRENKVRVCLENMFTDHNDRIMQAICSEMDEAIRYIDFLNEKAGWDCFGFCLDTGHLMLFAKDQYKAISTLGSRLLALHINDNDGYTDQHIAPYMGAVDWDAVTRGLREIGYNGALCFEAGKAYRRFDEKLLPDLLRLISACGRLFWERINGCEM